MYEVCRLLCAIHVLSQNGIIFATVSEAMLFPISQSETQAHRTELCDLTRARELQDSNPDLTNWKAWFLPHRPLRLLPQGLPGICQHPPPHTLVQNVGCRLYLSPFSTASLALAAPWPTEARVHAQQLLCHVALHQALGPEAGWGCHGNALPLDCLVSPTSHWNVSEIPPFRPASKPHLPDSHSHYEQQENLFRLCPNFQFGKQMATLARPPFGLYFPFLFHSVLSLSCCPVACDGFTDTDRARAQILVLLLPRHLTLDLSLGLISLFFIGMIIIISASLTFM